VVNEGANSRRVTAPLTLALGAMAATAPFSMDAYLPALPAIAAEFGVSAQVVQLSLSACLLGLGIGQLVAGPLGDRYGRRIPMLIGAALYIVASLGCAVSPDAGMLIAFRGLQGLGGAVGLVLSRAVVRDIATGNTATRLYSQMAAVSSAAPVVAPIAGALLIGTAGWRAVFVGAAVVSALSAAAALLMGGAGPGGTVAAGLLMPAVSPTRRFVSSDSHADPPGRAHRR